MKRRYDCARGGRAGQGGALRSGLHVRGRVQRPPAARAHPSMSRRLAGRHLRRERELRESWGGRACRAPGGIG